MHNENVSSTRGRALLKESADRMYYRLANFYTTQYHPYACGVASLTMVLNASGVERPVLYDDERRLFTQKNLMEDERVTSVFEEEYMEEMGIGIQDVQDVFENFGFKVTYHSSNNMNFEGFVKTLQQIRSNKFVIVNYHRKQLDQGSLPHITPAGALGEDDKHTLLFDVSRYYWQQTWVDNERLYDGVNTMDSSGNYARGVLIVESGDSR